MGELSRALSLATRLEAFDVTAWPEYRSKSNECEISIGLDDTEKLLERLESAK